MACVDSRFSSWNFRPSLSFGEGVGRIRRRFSFSVIRRPALVTALPAVSYRANASAGRRATCARGVYGVCRLSIFELEFSAVFILWRRGRPHPAAVFFFGYSATGAGDGAAGCQLPGQRERGAARDLRQRAAFRIPRPFSRARARAPRPAVSIRRRRCRAIG